jgi:hypothetical protein
MSAVDPMDHAAAHDRIEDLLLEPRRLAALDTSASPQDVALREHVAGCPACAADLEAWRRMQRAVAAAIPTDDPAALAAALDPVELPPSLRTGIIAAIHDTDRGDERQPATAKARPVAAPPPEPIAISAERQRRRLAPLLALAASFVVLVGAGLVTVDQMGRRSAAEADARELASAIAVVDRMLATDHKVVALKTTAGAAAGTISWSRHDWVVLTNALGAPAAGQTYLCWLETDGRSLAVGQMEFAGSTAYWVATLDEWKTWEIGPTTTFLVTLEPAGATERSGDPILEARLAS